MTKFRSLVAVLLISTLAVTACDAQKWLNVAIADLPVLVQMAINISSLVATVQNDPVSPEQQAAIQRISEEAQKDLQLLSNLYTQYKSDPSVGVLQQIEASIAEINTNLPALLAAAHVSNPVLAQQVAAAVSLILATVTTFAALIPTPSTPVVVSAKAKVGHPHKMKVPTPKELKAQWNHEVAPQFN